MGKVNCPICDAVVEESDINLHIDLLCRGAPGDGSVRETQRTPSQKEGSQKKQILHSDPIVIDSTPPPPRSRPAVRQSNGGGGGMFGKRPAPADDRLEKRQRVNPLKASAPLAERSRPSSLDKYIGQTDLVGPGSLLRSRIEAGEGVGSCILWGPPGCGKTTLARLIARTANADFKELSATSAGAADVRQVFEQAKNGLTLTGRYGAWAAFAELIDRKTILMVDEIHRFTKPQQDLFLPYVENGWVQLIGATTENPSFKVNGALLSRCQVFTLSSHTPADLEAILQNAVASLENPPELPAKLIPFLAEVADGDARQALNGLELALKVCESPPPMQTTLNETEEGARERRDKQLMEAVRRGLRKGYDRSGEERYDMISALHKCLRGSDGSAAMYWLARMLTGGEDPLYIARRLVVVASEDVGLADNHALPLAMATYQACQVIGMPECRINLAHCVAYLAEAPKSTRSYKAYNRAAALASKPPLPGVPLQVRNAPTKLMKQLGYGKSYSYNPDYAHPVINDYLPTEIASMSSHAPDKSQHILRTPEEDEKERRWDESRLLDWEAKVNRLNPWEGRKEREGKPSPPPAPSSGTAQDIEREHQRGSEYVPRRG